MSTNLDLASITEIHATLMFAIGALFAAIRVVDRDWDFPWQFAAGYLMAPVLIGLISFSGLPDRSMLALGLVIGFAGAAFLMMGLCKLAGRPVHFGLWAGAFGLFLAGHAVVVTLGAGRIGHILILNLSLVALWFAVIRVAQELPADAHRLGRPLIIGLGTIVGLTHLARIGLILGGYGPAIGADRFSAIMLLGATVVGVLVAVGIVVMVAERLAAQIGRQARTDALTGLVVRRVFNEQLSAELERWKRYARPFAVCVFDVDHFKQVNDRHGHDVGDAALQLVARCGSGVLRPNDLFARIGGDEFALLLPESRTEEGVEVAKRLLAALQASPLVTPDGTVTLSGSFGVSVPMAAADSSDMIVKRADRALYLVKRRGRNGVASYDDVTNDQLDTAVAYQPG